MKASKPKTGLKLVFNVRMPICQKESVLVYTMVCYFL